MPFADLGDFCLYYNDVGTDVPNRFPIIWLHGFTLDHRMWRPQVEFFAPGRRLILPDARGHGCSGITPTGYSRADRVEDLLRLADILKIERFHLVGLSMGGSTAVGFALKYPDRLNSLSLLSTGVAGYGAGKKIDRLDVIGRNEGAEAAKAKWMEWALAWYQEPARAHIGMFMQEMIEQYSGAVWADPMRGKYPREFDLERVHTIKTPTLIIAGALDRIFVPLARTLHDKISSSQLIVYPGIGHMVNLEYPDQLNADLKVFLEGLSQ
jgi:pimeloyl-ACP methyl ester carboxylesterase